MIYFSFADGAILIVLFMIFSLIALKIIKNRKEGICSSCSVYKNAKRKSHDIKDFYEKVKND